MNTEDLRIFLSVADHGSFSLGAEHVNLTQPAVSKRIAKLEHELGARLFDRIARRVTLTEAGIALQGRARSLIHELEVLRTSLGEDQDSPSGSLAIAISHHLGLHRFPPLLQRFTQSYPQVSLDVRFVDSERAYEAVVQGSVDLGVITLAPEEHANVYAISLWTDRLYYVCSRDHPLAQRKTVRLADISTAGCLLPSLATYTGRIIKQAFDREGLTLHPVMTTNYLETLAKMTEIGLGWSVLPETLVSPALKILDLPSPLERRLGVIYHRQRTLSRAGQAMLSLLERTLDQALA